MLLWSSTTYSMMVPPTLPLHWAAFWLGPLLLLPLLYTLSFDLSFLLTPSFFCESYRRPHIYPLAGVASFLVFNGIASTQIISYV